MLPNLNIHHRSVSPLYVYFGGAVSSVVLAHEDVDIAFDGGNNNRS